MGTTAQSDTFKVDLYNGGHNFKASGGLTYKLLLIKASPTGTYDQTLANVGTPGSGTPSTTNVGTDEVSGAGYTTGGVTLTNGGVTLYGDTAVATFTGSPSWSSATFSASAAVIYTTDSSTGTAGRVVGVFDLGGVQTVSGATFTLTIPVVGASTGLIRSL